MVKKTLYPAIPRKNPERAMQALTEASEILTGATGNGLDKAVTYRDLRNIGIVNFKQATNGKIRSVVAVDPTVDPNVGVPPPPVMLAVTGTFSTVLIEWIGASYFGHAYTEIYRNSEDNLSTASFLGSSRHTSYTDMVGTGETNYYWVRFVNINNIAGAYNDITGTIGATRLTPREVLLDYSQGIYAGNNYKWLNSELGLMDSLNRAFEAAGFDPDTGLANLLSNSNSISDLLAEQALMSALDKHTQRTEIKAQFSKNYARLSSGIHAAVSADEAYVQRITTLESKWENDLNAIISADITEYDLALTSPTGAITTQINQQTVSYDGNEVSLQQLASTTANNDGKYEAQWGVKALVGDLQGGVGFYNDGVTTSFLINANTFAVTGGDSEVVPFVIKDGKTVMETALIDHASIYTLIASNVVAENIKSSLYMHTPIMSAGKVFGSRIQVGGSYAQVIDPVTGLVTDVLPDANSPFQVDTNGYMQATGATLKQLTVLDAENNVILGSGGIEYGSLNNLPSLGALASLSTISTGSISDFSSEVDTKITTKITAAYIKTLLVNQLISASIYAENIEGDVTDSLAKPTTEYTGAYDLVTEKTLVSFTVSALPFVRTIKVDGGLAISGIPTQFVDDEYYFATEFRLLKSGIEQDKFTVRESMGVAGATANLTVLSTGLIGELPANTAATFTVTAKAIDGSRQKHLTQKIILSAFKRGSTIS